MTTIVAESPLLIPVRFANVRTGISKTRARKIPTNTMRNVSPIARNARASARAASTTIRVRTGLRSSMRPARGDSMARKATPGCGWTWMLAPSRGSTDSEVFVYLA